MLQGRTLIIIYFFVFGQCLFAQESFHQFTNENAVEKAFQLYDENMFDAAHHQFGLLLNDEVFVNELAYAQKSKISYYKALSALHGNNEDVNEIVLFIENEKTNPWINNARIDVAVHYYNQEDFQESINYFSEVDLDGLSNERFSEVHFKKAYAHFVRKDFGVTISLLKKILHLRDEYYFPATYYYGLAHYFEDDLEEAVSSFQKLSTAAQYQDRIPYYISQILFKQKKYLELIDYASAKIDIESIENLKEIRGILGQAYFIKKDYPNAIEHLSYYAENTNKLRAEDFYQLGFAYYQTRQYSKAIAPFKEIANVSSKMGQNANNYLANSYLSTSDKNAARAAFKRTSEMTFIPDLSEEALFNYGKLSAEMGQDREALNSLKLVEPSSLYFPESQKILSHILNNTEDYSEAIRFIENLDMKSPPIRKSYQRLAYTYGMQFLLDNNIESAVSYFNKANDNQLDNEITALTYYRLADIDHDKGFYQQSVNRLNQYFSLANTGINLPQDANLTYANYLQAYNYLKSENYTLARKYFEDASQGFNSIPGTKKLNMDALLRTADCYFKVNVYQKAIDFYNQAIKINAKGTDYALYQRGILQGLLGKPFEKIVTMDELIERFPKSPLTDFAIFQNGETLQSIGESVEAERSFRRIVDEFKKSTLRNKSLLKLGLIAFNQGNVTTSISYYKELFNQNPSASESQQGIIALEEIYVETLGKPEEFFDFVEKQAGFKMNSYEKDSISFRSGDIQYENADYEKAVSAYSRYIKNYPSGFNKIVAHFRRGESYAFQKQFELALNDYEFVIKQGENQYYLKSLEKAAIITYNSTEDFKKAFDYYSLLEEIELDPEKQYQFQLGALRSAVRIEDNKAIRYMGERLLKNQYLTNDDKSLALFQLAKVNFSDDKIDESYTQLKQVVSLSNNINTAEARYMIANIAYLKGNIDNAEAECRQAIVDSKPYPFWVAKSMLLLSDIFLKRGDLLQSKAALNAILENFDSNQEIIDETKIKLSHILAVEAEKNRVDLDTSKGELKMDKSQGNN